MKRKVFSRDMRGMKGGLKYEDVRGMKYADPQGMKYMDMRGMKYADSQGMKYADMRGMKYADQGGLEYADLWGRRYADIRGMKCLMGLGLFVFFLLGARPASAQSGADYFPGKWKVTVFGTPNGDAVMFFLLERKDGKLTGAVRDSTDKEMTRFTQIDEKEKNITVYFTAQGYDVNVYLEPVPADSVKGNLLGMFDTRGVRVKEVK